MKPRRIVLFGAMLAALAGPVTVGFWITPAQAQSQSQAQQLDELFAALKSAPDHAAAQRITTQIWTLWTQPDDPALAERMSLVLLRLGMSDLGGAVGLLDALVIDYPDYARFVRVTGTNLDKINRVKFDLKTGTVDQMTPQQAT